MIIFFSGLYQGTTEKKCRTRVVFSEFPGPLAVLSHCTNRVSYILSSFNSWWDHFSLSLYTTERNSKYCVPASWFLSVQSLLKAFPLCPASVFFPHASQVPVLWHWWLTTPKANFMGLQPVQSYRAQPEGLVSWSHYLEILNNLFFEVK